MADDLGARAKIEIDTSSSVNAISSLTREMHRLSEGDYEVAKSIDPLLAKLNNVERSVKRAAGATDQNTAATKAGATAATGYATAVHNIRTSTDLTASNLPRLRYALYDVSNALAIGGAAMLAFSVITYKTAIDYQKQFADVIRTTGVDTPAAIETLKSSLIGLSQNMPVSFSDITGIATLAGQLGVAQNRIADFTKVTAEFSATTNVSVGDSATAFGRLDSLLPDVQGNYNKLGSAILKVGVNSVATESQIISISQRIAGIANVVGLTSDEVVGLSGTLASLGVQPELAQGSVTRLFTKIQTAASMAGTAQENFGRLSGQSGAQFAAAWQNNPGQTLIKILEGINAAGPDTIQAIAGIGLSGARDLPTISKLAQNTGELSKNMNLAADAAGKGTELNKQYGTISGTVAAKLTVLTNNFKAMLDAVGSSATGIGNLVDVGSDFLKWLTDVSSNPFTSTLLGWGIGLATLTALLALGAAGFLRLAATMAAVQTAAGVSGATGALGVFGSGLSVIRAGITGASAANVGLAATTNGTSAAMSRGAIAADVLGTALKALTIVGLAFVAVDIASGVFDEIRKFEGLRTSADGLAQSLKKVNEQKVLGDLGLNDSHDFGQVTSGVAAQAVGAPGASAAQALGPLSSAFGFDRYIKNAKDYDTALAAMVQSGNGKHAAEIFKLISDAAKEQGASLEKTKSVFPLYAEAQKNATAATKAAAPTFEEYKQALTDSMSAVSDAVDGNLKVENSLYSLGSALGENGNDFSLYSESGRANLQALQSVIAAYTSDAQGNAGVLASNLQALFDGIMQAAPGAAGALAMVRDAISATGATGAVATSGVNFASLFSGFATGQKKARDEMAKTRNAAAKEIRTLVDYANDLSGVFKRAFDIRFGGGQGLDGIASGWSKIRQASSDAADAMAKANVTLQGLVADRAVQEYWLTVANAYGDTLRASQIQADLAKNAQDTADAQKDLTKAQTANSKTLVGNSDAAIANRETILGMVSTYEDYIKALAASGVDQATLKAKSAELRTEFINQATQAGFSRGEIDKYASAFDDMSTAISKVPRNITVRANTDPALQALNEFIAKAKSSIGNGIDIPFHSSYDPSGAAKQARAAQLQLQLAGAQSVAQRFISSGSDNAASRWLAEVDRISAILNSGNYADGGYTGPGGKYDYAGAVHRGEFVFSAAATANIGPGNLAFMHNMAKTGQGFGVSNGAGGGSGVVQLSQYDRQLLSDIRDRVGVTIAPGALQGAVNAANQNASNRRNA